jgi:hypothetical protein
MCAENSTPKYERKVFRFLAAISKHTHTAAAEHQQKYSQGRLVFLDDINLISLGSSRNLC